MRAVVARLHTDNPHKHTAASAGPEIRATADLITGSERRLPQSKQRQD
jgi:hypothetical protein